MSATFDHRERGTPEADWQRARPWAAARPLDPDSDLARDLDAVIVLAAHPDDETLGAGGLMATAAARGVRVIVVVATDGDSSHPDSPTWTPRALARERRLELARAVDQLAPGSALSFLGLPDGQLREHRTRLTGLMRSLILAEVTDDPLRTLVVSPWSGDGHRDHRVLGEVAEHLASELGHRSLGYPIWLWHWARPADVETRGWTVLTLDRDAHAAKLRALPLHDTQVRPLSPAPGDEALIHDEMRAHFERDVEVFVAPVLASNSGAGASEPESLTPTFFDDFYARHDDPWGFDTRWYEERKRALVLAALPRPRFRNALELGCATGALTVGLAARADRVLGLDASVDALDRARARLASRTDIGGVTLERATLPQEWPEPLNGAFDLIVLSEIGYYWGPQDLRDAARKTLGSLSEDGVLVACHWRHPVAEYPGTADDVHSVLRSLPGLRLLARHDEEDFFLDVLVRTEVPSVARAAGIAP